MNKLSSLFMNQKKIDLATIGTLLCLILATVGIDPISLQSWPDVGTAIMAVVMNPYKIALIVGAVYGWYRNNQEEQK